MKISLLDLHQDIRLKQNRIIDKEKKIYNKLSPMLRHFSFQTETSFSTKPTCLLNSNSIPSHSSEILVY